MTKDKQLADLRLNLEITEGLLKGFIWWNEMLVAWHYRENISPQVFEDTLIALARCDILNIYEGTIEMSELYKAVTGQRVDEERLRQIYDLFNPYV